MSISGMPQSREDWPPEVLDAAARFTCGDIVESPPNFYYADPEHAVLEYTKRYAEEGVTEAEVIDAYNTAAPFGVITSQTCDIGEIGFAEPSHPFVSVSPVFDGTSSLDGSTRSLLKKGKRIGPFYHVPLLSEHATGFWVADFRIEMPIEKGWLVKRDPIKGFVEEHARMIPKVLADIRDRPAWAPSVSDHLQPMLLQQLKELKLTDPAIFELVTTEIEEIGARSDSMLEPTWVQLAAFTVGQVSPETKGWWTAVNDVLREEAGRHGLVFHQPETLGLEECPVMTYRRFTTFPLTRFSPP